MKFLSQHDPNTSARLLIGEAPGHRGAAVTGVPFTSLQVLTEPESDPWGAFGGHRGYREPPTRFGPYSRREATATMIWRSLSDLFGREPLPLTWNAVPFHPSHGDRRSNRSLRPAEIAIGHQWLEGFLELFPNSIPIAVGRSATRALDQLGIAHQAVRHPSRGGRDAFHAGLIQLSAGHGTRGARIAS